MCAGVYLRECTTGVWSYDRVFCSVDMTLVIKPAVKPSLETSYQAPPSETTGLERIKARGTPANLGERAHDLLFWSRKKVRKMCNTHFQSARKGPFFAGKR